MNYFEPVDDREKFSNIKKELDKYSYSFKIEFKKTYPSEEKEYVLFIKNIILKSRSVGATTMAGGAGGTLYFEKIYFSSAEDFWERWNRFKKLKVFL